MKKIILISFTLLCFVSHSFSQVDNNEKLITEKNYQEIKLIENGGGFSLVERWAMYPDGKQGINNLISNNLVYPKKAIKKKIEGLVTVKYIVQIDGTITDIKVIRKVHPLLDNEAVRIIKLMDKWIPAIQRGKPVKTAYNQEFNFKL